VGVYPLFQSLLSAITGRVRDEDGQGMAEYALIISLIAIAAILALLYLSGALNGLLDTIGSYF
jgi:Flp pilus assembly pilin Flp